MMPVGEIPESGNHIRAVFERADASNVWLIGPAVTETAFHHYAYVRTGLVHKLFLDGGLVAIDTLNDIPGDTGGLPLVIGALRNDPSPTGFIWHFGGIIDEVQVFDRAFSDDEIADIFEATKPNAQLAVTVRASYKNSQRSAVVVVAVGN